jgi:hypothetical protein
MVLFFLYSASDYLKKNPDFFGLYFWLFQFFLISWIMFQIFQNICDVFLKGFKGFLNFEVETKGYPNCRF